MSDETGSAPVTPNEARSAETKLYGASGEPLRRGPNPNPAQTDQLAEFIREQPFTAALAALVVGYFLGKIT